MIHSSDEILSLTTLRQGVREICEPRGVARVELFGSYAQEVAHADSDIDLLIEFLPETAAGLFEMGEIQQLLQEQLGREVDVISKRAIEQSHNPFARRTLLSKPVLIYA